MATVRVLLVEDNPGDARLILEGLKDSDQKDFELKHTERLSEAINHLKTENYHVVLLDLSLPDSKGFDTFLKLSSAYPKTPIVVLTGLDDEVMAFDAFKKGVQNYLIKGRIDPKIIGSAIQYALERHRLIDELGEVKV